jgi:hypothetical protein
VAGSASAQTLRRHDEERARLAREAASAFGNGSEAAFEAMLANADRIEARDLALLAERNQLTVQTTLTALPSWTWLRLGEQARATQAAYDDAARQALATIAGSDAALPSLQGQLTNARARQVEARNAERALAEKEMAQLATTKQFNDAIDALRSGKVAAVTPSVKTLLDNFKAADNARGAQLSLLELARELADVEVARLNAQLRGIRWKIAQSEELLARIDAVTGANGLLPRVIQYAAGQPQDQTIAATVRERARQAQQQPAHEDDLRLLLENLARYSSVVGYERLFLNQSALLMASEEQRDSIRISAINLRERAVLLEHGLDGLVSYYEGGLSPGDLGNIFNAAQTIALAVIAGRIE